MAEPGVPTHAAAPRSSFVTVVAWVFIVLAGFATFISLLQNLMVTLMPHDLFNEPLKDTTFTHTIPSAGRLILAHFRLLVLITLTLCALTLTAAIGLLRRRNWARVVFIGLLGFGIIYSIAGVFLQHSFFSSFNTFNAQFQADSTMRRVNQAFSQMMGAMRIFMVAFDIGLAALLAWIILKLTSPAVREEFRPVG